jgi:hypothetical protein
MRCLFLFLILIFLGLRVYTQDSYSLYFNYRKSIDFTYNNSLYKSDQIYFIECEEGLVHISNHYIKIDSYPDYCVFYFDDELVGEYKIKRWVNHRHIILYFIESKTYYYFYTN